jgi:hypothetical protein
MFPTDIFGKARGLFAREPEPKPAPVKKAPQHFHAVAIVTGGKACAEARALEAGGKRYLSRTAPVLPLKNCNCSTCECRYVHYEDRRKGVRRARDIGVSIAGFEGSDVRQKAKRGRRNVDR